ncbi:MAG: hypothetical protein ABW128_11300 [Rhizorhabdus sp.]
MHHAAIAHAPDCACPRCRHLRFVRAARRFGEGLLPACYAAAGIGAIMIPGRAALTLAARLLSIG